MGHCPPVPRADPWTIPSAVVHRRSVGRAGRSPGRCPMTATASATPRPRTALRVSARRLAAGMAALVVVDVVGGVLAVATDVNTWSQAWGPQALLAAPLPMTAAQVLLVVLATRTSRRWGAAPAVV